MPCLIEPQRKGYTISFQTRGLTDEEASNIWLRLHPLDLKSLTKDTGHNLLVWGDGLVAEIMCGRGDNISVWCGKELDK